MGKASRKMNKQHQKKSKSLLAQNVQQLELQMNEQFEAEEYADAINTLAELVTDKVYDPELLYKGAYSYFMVGDYTRSAQMVENTLNFEPNHIAARILLARICILEDRTDDGLAIFDFILEHYEASLTAVQQEDIEDILEYYGRNEQDRLVADFPHVAAFLSLTSGVQQVESAPVEQPVVPEASAAVTAVEAEIQSVMEKNIALVEKLRILQAFAGAHYTAGNYAAAAKLLEAAVRLDDTQPELLRNMAVVVKRMGQPERALKLAAKLPQTDFLLLEFLKQ